MNTTILTRLFSLFTAIFLFSLLTLPSFAAENDSNWRPTSSSPTITFLDADGGTMEAFQNLPAGDPDLSFTSSYVNYGSLSQIEYSAVDLKFTYIDYNCIIPEENAEDYLPLDLQTVVELTYNDTVLEANDFSFSRSPRGYLMIDIFFEEVLPFEDENNEVSLFIQYFPKNLSGDVSSEPSRSNIDYLFTRMIQPSLEDETVPEEEKMQIDIILPEKEEEEPSIRSETPYLIIEEFTLTDGASSVSAGNTIEATVTARNTHKKLRLDNVLMQVQTPDGIRLQHAGNSFHIGDVRKDGTFTQTLSFYVSPSASFEDHSITISFDYEYVDDDARRYDSISHKVVLPVTQPLRFSIDLVETLPTYLINEQHSIFSGYVNRSRSTIYNVTATLNSELYAPEKVLHLGNLSAGEGDSCEFKLLALAAGEYPAEIVYSYENEFGQTYSINTSFTMNFEAPPEEEEEVSSEESTPVIQYITEIPSTNDDRSISRQSLILIGLTSSVLLIAVLAFLRKPK